MERVRLPFGERRHPRTRRPGRTQLAPRPDLTACIAAVEADQAALETALAAQGLRSVGGGIDPRHDPQRVTADPRYQAMEVYFDREGPWGRTMMCSTASIQVNLDAGDESGGPGGFVRRWHLAHRIGPVLVAAFANSPLPDGASGGWKSARQALWGRIDPGRTRPMPDTDDPADVFAQYALDAQVMCVRRERARPGPPRPA